MTAMLDDPERLVTKCNRPQAAVPAVQRQRQLPTNPGHFAAGAWTSAQVRTSHPRAFGRLRRARLIDISHHLSRDGFLDY